VAASVDDKLIIVLVTRVIVQQGRYLGLQTIQTNRIAWVIWTWVPIAPNFQRKTDSAQCRSHKRFPTKAFTSRAGQKQLLFIYFLFEAWSYLMDLLSLRLVGVVEVRNYVWTSFSQWTLSIIKS